MPPLPDNILGMDPVAVISVLVAACTLVIVAAITMVFEAQNSPRARLRKRMDTVVGVETPTKARDRKTEGASRSNRRQIQNKLKEIEAKKKASKRRNRVRQELQQAGLSLTARKFMLASAVVGLAGGGISILFGASLFAAVPLAIAVSLTLPRWVVRFMGKRRKKAFTSQFAGGLDVIVRGIQSGLPVDECFKVIAQESGDPMAHEFRLILEGQKLGLSIDEVLQRAYDRIPTPELKFFATVLSIQRQTGGNLAETLTNLSKLLRDRHRMEGKVRALSSEARASAMIIASLPFFVAIILSFANTEYISLMIKDVIGHVMLAGCVTTVIIGTLVMKKMTSFEI